MNTKDAIDYLIWEVSEKGATPKKAKALKTIIEYKEAQDKINTEQNSSLAKLYCASMNNLLTNGQRTTREANRVVSDALKFDLLNHIEILKGNIFFAEYNAVGKNKHPFDVNDIFNITKMQEHNKTIIDEYTPELTKVFETEVTTNQVIKFVENNINQIIKTEKTEIV